MLACASAAGAVLPAEWSASYGPEGSCWTGTQREAESCDTFCESTVAGYRNAYPTIEACQ